MTAILRQDNTEKYIVHLYVLRFNVSSIKKIKKQCKSYVIMMKTAIYETMILGITYNEKLLYFNARTKSPLLKIPTVPRYLVKLSGIFEDKIFPNEQTIAHQKLQKPYIAINRRPTKVITTIPDQTSVHWDSTIQRTVTIPLK